MFYKKKHKIFLNPKKSSNYIVIIAIGDKHFDEWKKYSSKLLIKYCKINNLGLIVIKDYLAEGNNYYAKKATLQKFLVGSYLKKNFKFIKNICYLDTDILVNPFAPNIFNYHKSDKISVVSKYNNLPYPQSDHFIKRNVAFLRKTFYDKKFPLDSGLTMSLEQHYIFHGWKNQGDYFCAGLVMYNLEKFSNFFERIFNKYSKKNLITMTGGDEPIYNYEVLKNKKVNWLDYKFQALWLYEISSKYPFLYEYKITDPIVSKCIEASLKENYFLHFSGKWPEGLMWKNKNIFSLKTQKNYLSFLNYLKIKLKSIPKKNIIFKNFKKIL